MQYELLFIAQYRIVWNEISHEFSSEEESRRRIKDLTQQIQNIRQEKAEELARRAEVIAYQKDQLQEAKAKAQLEITYEKKKCENHLEQVRERCFLAEQEMRREQEVIIEQDSSHLLHKFSLMHFQSLENRYEDEMKCNSETENFLRGFIKVITLFLSSIIILSYYLTAWFV